MKRFIICFIFVLLRTDPIDRKLIVILLYGELCVYNFSLNGSLTPARTSKLTYYFYFCFNFYDFQTKRIQ